LVQFESLPTGRQVETLKEAFSRDENTICNQD